MRKTKLVEVSELDPWIMFLNAMRSPVTKDRYSTRVAKFFGFIEIPGRTLEQNQKSTNTLMNIQHKWFSDIIWI